MDACATVEQDKLAKLRQQIVDTLLEIDNINLQVNPRILARYAKSIGYLENDLFKWQLKARRAKRKFALAQAAVNKGESVSLDVLESALDSEFAEWEARLATRLDEQLHILETLAGSRALSPASTRELKALHKRLIKRLHPDLHPSLPEDAHRFFLIAQSAYENGDLAMLQAVDAATEDYEDAWALPELTESDLEIEIAMAEAQLNIAAEKLDALKRSHPYMLLELLDDAVALTKRRAELEAEIERQKEAARSYEERAASLEEGECR